LQQYHPLKFFALLRSQTANPQTPIAHSSPKFLKLTMPLPIAIKAFWKFSRPHTIIGTSLSAVSLFLIALGSLDQFQLWQLQQLFLAWIACLAGNIYIVGLNQIEDVAIDRINKPHLPLASGEFSQPQAWRIVIFMGLLAVGIALHQGVWLLATVGISLVIGTAYSLSPIRLKRFAFWASVCIFTVRGVVVNLGLFLHYRQVITHELASWASVPAAVWLLTLFILAFTFAIAIFKDIPDLSGDRQFNIKTLTVQLGQQVVYNLALTVLFGCYLGMILTGIVGITGVNQLLLVSSHSALLGLLWVQSQRVDLQGTGKNPQRPLSYTRFYQFIWRLFFLEYLIFPIVCLVPNRLG